MLTIWSDKCDFLCLTTIIHLSFAKLPLAARSDVINALKKVL